MCMKQYVTLNLYNHVRKSGDGFPHALHDGPHQQLDVVVICDTYIYDTHMSRMDGTDVLIYSNTQHDFQQLYNSRTTGCSDVANRISGTLIGSRHIPIHSVSGHALLVTHSPSQENTTKMLSRLSAGAFEKAASLRASRTSSFVLGVRSASVCCSLLLFTSEPFAINFNRSDLRLPMLPL